MNKNNYFLVMLIGSIILAGCEMPGKPNFTASHKVEAPLLYNKSFNFMGDSTALIDTTSSDMDSLFSVDGDNFITISKEQDFDFGDLNGAVPVIDVDPTSFESEVGELELTNFSSDDGNLGEAGFEDLTGINPLTVSTGDPVPNQVVNPEVTIDLETDLFESAIFKSGALDITLKNNLGFNLDQVNITLVSDPDTFVNGDEQDLSSTQTGLLNDDERITVSIPFDNCQADPASCQLANPNVRVSIEWTGTGQNFQRDPQSLVVESAVGNELTASQVQAALEEQDFSTNNVTFFDDSEFEFTKPSHFIKLKTGWISVNEIVNELRFDIESMIISFPDIQECPANLKSSNPIVTNNNPLEISYINAKRIPRASDNGNVGIAPAEDVNIAGCTLYAEGNEVNYDIFAITENTQNAAPGNQIRLVNETQAISSSVEIHDITILIAFGIVKAQNELLNDDEGEDEKLDLFNPNEAELTEIDGLADLSSQLEGLEFTNPSLSINYFSNIGLPTTIFGAFVGTNSRNEEVFLTGNAGGEYQIKSADPVDGLQANGIQLASNNLIRFSLEEIDNPTGIYGDPIIFNRDNSNVNNFLNSLPDQIRFIGKSVINQDEGEATILDTLIFDPKISIDIPLAFRADQAVFSDTTDELDFGDLPSTDKGDSGNITDGILKVDYENGLPLGVNVTLAFLDENGQEFESISGENSIQLASAGVDNNSRFVDNPNIGTTAIVLSTSQLRQLYKTKNIKFNLNINTTNSENIKIKTDDFIKLSVRAELTIESEIN
ncbi:MAG: hypothetical protein WD059_01975 [Balneolaceae bacterium]